MKSIQVLEIFWSLFSHNWNEYGDLQSKSPNPNQIRENKEQEKLRIISVYSPSTEYTDQNKKRIWTLFTQNVLHKK